MQQPHAGVASRLHSGLVSRQTSFSQSRWYTNEMASSNAPEHDEADDAVSTIELRYVVDKDFPDGEGDQDQRLPANESAAPEKPMTISMAP